VIAGDKDKDKEGMIKVVHFYRSCLWSWTLSLWLQGTFEKINTSNTICFDYEQKIRQYDTAEEILDDFGLYITKTKGRGFFFIELCCSGVTICHGNAFTVVIPLQSPQRRSVRFFFVTSSLSATNLPYALILLLPSIGFHHLLSSRLPTLEPWAAGRHVMSSALNQYWPLLCLHSLFTLSVESLPPISNKYNLKTVFLDLIQFVDQNCDWIHLSFAIFSYICFPLYVIHI